MSTPFRTAHRPEKDTLVVRTLSVREFFGALAHAALRTPWRFAFWRRVFGGRWCRLEEHHLHLDLAPLPRWFLRVLRFSNGWIPADRCPAELGPWPERFEDESPQAQWLRWYAMVRNELRRDHRTRCTCEVHPASRWSDSGT